jgi:PHS family inorganic phosphate transporter-like MFS transporter
MLASVLIMQPIGQFTAYLVGLIILSALKSHYGVDALTNPNTARPLIDQFWRLVTGLGAIPAFVALAFRFSIPESGRWTLDVGKDSQRAVADTQMHFGSVGSAFSSDLELENLSSVQPETTSFSRDGLKDYFLAQGNWRTLVAASGCWFMVDFAFYGLQINSPRFISKLWASSAAEKTVTLMPAWKSDPQNANASIYEVLTSNAHHAMIAVSSGSILGAVLLILLIPYIRRRRFFIISFLLLAFLTPAVGVSFLKTFRTSNYGVTLALFIVSQTFFNLGPNGLTYIVSCPSFRLC